MNITDYQFYKQITEIIENADTLLKIDCVRFDKLHNKSALKRSISEQGIKLYGKRI